MRVRRTATALLLTAAALLGCAPLAQAEIPRATADFPTGTATAPDGRVLFTDVRGRTVEPRGFNVDKYDETTEADLRSIAADGFTLIRVAVSWNRLEPAQGRYDGTELAKLRRLLDWADQDGLLAVVDFHQDVYGPVFGGGDRGIPPWATRDDGLPFVPDPDDWFAGYFQPAVQAAFRHLYDDPDLRRWQADFYTHIARELRGHRSLLGYDLFNEPFGPVLGDPGDPAVLAASSAQLEQGRLALMYQRLIDAIRGVDQHSWLFVEPTVLVGEGIPTQLPGFDDPRPGPARLGYAPHFYDTAVENGADWNPADGFIEAYTAAITDYPRRHRMPLLVGEWGPPSAATPGNAELVRRQIAAMAGFASGWTMWYWCRGNGGYCALGPDGRPAGGDGPAFGPYAAVLAGLPSTESWTADRYTVAFTATGGWTELVAPPSARLTVTGSDAVEVDRRSPGRLRLRVPHGARVVVESDD
ncbi:glycoside hydrolase family 5 protein [Kitasatospora sp. RB6PN24]|uniref:glycoside hydrolase family 5 protein n=1 Tax=Kitasatospora humi TaxID=2893891 RepID=UPI001E5F4964|nr:cellulase family glycosylhydrolase [Kitasatospora humi]MCC9306315.1 glycoside hydrolase family 5 protein [Kitasatospora humi]